MLAAWRRGTSVDVVSLTFSLFMWSLPTFFLAILLVFGSSSSTFRRRAKKPSAPVRLVGEELVDILRHLAMPTLAFTLVLLGEYMLIMRSSVLDVFSEDYILTAKAKGLTTFQIIKDHALRAMLPMVTLIAINLAFTVSGAIQVEEVFSLAGLGNLTVEAISERDYPVLQGAFLLIAVAVVIANLVPIWSTAGWIRGSRAHDAGRGRRPAERRPGAAAPYLQLIRRPMGAHGLSMLTLAVLVAILAP